MIIGLTGQSGSGKDTIASIISNRIPGTEKFSFAAPLKEFVEAVFQFPKDWLYGASELREREHPTNETIRGTDRHFWDLGWRSHQERFWSLGGGFSREWLAACGLSPASKGVGSAFVDWFDKTRHEIEKDPKKFTARYILQTLGTEFGRECIDRDVWLKVGLDRITRSPAPVKVITDVRFDNEAAGLLDLWKRAPGWGNMSNTAEVWKVVRNTGKTSDHASERGVDQKYITRTFPNFGSIDSLRDEVHEALFLTGMTEK